MCDNAKSQNSNLYYDNHNNDDNSDENNCPK